MEYRKLDKLGIETSLLGFGCMRFPTDANGKIDEKRAEEMLDLAYKNGINYYDTAYPYHDGASEPFVGKVMKKYDRSSFYFATKLPVWDVNSVEDAKRIFAHQLERLQTDYVDFYLLHALGKDRWEKMVELGVVDYCAKLKEEGKIRYLGFSFHDDYEVFEQIATYRDWDFCQIQYNYMDTDEQAGNKGYELTERLGIPLIIMEPIKGGSLAKLPEDIMPILNEYRPGASAAAWALTWVGSHPNVKVILSGMSNMEQTEENIKTFHDFRALSEAEWKAVDEVAAALRRRVMNGCTGCRYCMPCPAGVDIPWNFRVWNQYHIYMNEGALRWTWFKEMAESVKPANCIRCGKCEKSCPQKISIRDDLKKMNEEMKELFAGQEK